MPSKREESAIDAIYQILDKIELLDQRMQIIDTNVKNLSNKITKLGAVPTPAVGARSVDPSPTISDMVQTEGKVDRLVLGNVKVFGYIVNKAKRPIEGVAINVYDKSNKLIKNILTNHDGYWEVRVPCGAYGVEYIHNKFRPINRTIEIPEGSKEYEVR
tara:strand:- start:6500 stop:6976 length:477 start_codon:yes stop_codon:yes gene_type:complete